MSLETELETPVNAEAVEVGEFVSILAMTSNELIGQLWDISNKELVGSLTEQEIHYKQMIVTELKLRMPSHTL